MSSVDQVDNIIIYLCRSVRPAWIRLITSPSIGVDLCVSSVDQVDNVIIYWCRSVCIHRGPGWRHQLLIEVCVYCVNQINKAIYSWCTSVYSLWIRLSTSPTVGVDLCSPWIRLSTSPAVGVDLYAFTVDHVVNVTSCWCRSLCVHRGSGCQSHQLLV